MTWTRLHDGWTDSPELGELSLSARWHYLAMIQWCSKNALYDGVVRMVDARRCSDIDDPTAALVEMTNAHLITIGADTVQVERIDQHIPPPSVRDASDKAKIRMRRMRQHRNGDHSACLPETCDKSSVTPEVTRNTRTGQDGSGQGTTHPEKRTNTQVKDLIHPGQVTRNTSSNGHSGTAATTIRLATPVLDGLGCDWCGSTGPTDADGWGRRVCVGSCIQEGS